MNQQLTRWLEEQIADLKRQSLYKPPLVMDSAPGPRISVNGRKNVINLASNNYLGLAADPRLRTAAIRAIEQYGVGAGAVRSIIGTMSLHVEVEERLARFKGVEAAIYFHSGFNANVGVIPAVVGPGDAVLSDRENHSSIFAGIELAGVLPEHRLTYEHCDMASLEECLKQSQSCRRRLIITDGVFSMNGAIAPLHRIVALAEEYDACVMVDDAHGTGVLAGGRGTAAHFGLEDRVDIQLGTLSKAVGVMGGYIAGSRILIDWLKQRGRPYLWSTAPPVALAAAILAAIQILETDRALNDRLWENARYWKEGLSQIGVDTGQSETPITPVMLYEEAAALQLQKDLLEEGVLGLALVYPHVALGQARIRTIPSAAHTRLDLDQALRAFDRCLPDRRAGARNPDA